MRKVILVVALSNVVAGLVYGDTEIHNSVEYQYYHSDEKSHQFIEDRQLTPIMDDYKVKEDYPVAVDRHVLSSSDYDPSVLVSLPRGSNKIIVSTKKVKTPVAVASTPEQDVIVKTTWCDDSKEVCDEKS